MLLHNQSIYRVKVYALNFLPSNIKEMCQFYCQRCIITLSFTELETNNSLPLDKQEYLCPKCGEKGRAIYRLTLIVKDESTAGTDKFYKLYYYSHE